MAIKLMRCGDRAVLGVKFADKPAFPKERHRIHTVRRRALLACPKTFAVIFLQPIETSSTFRVIAVCRLPFEATGDLPKII
jgi:hypothetical protein